MLILMTHLQTANQTWFEHFKNSIGYSWKSFTACVFFTVHAFFPETFTASGSNVIKNLHKELSS
jgi:hypothetical protein